MSSILYLIWASHRDWGWFVLWPSPVSPAFLTCWAVTAPGSSQWILVWFGFGPYHPPIVINPMRQEIPLCVDKFWFPVPPPLRLRKHSLAFWTHFCCGSPGCYCELSWQSQRAGGHSQGLVILKWICSWITILPARRWRCLAGSGVVQPACILTRCMIDPPLIILVTVKINSHCLCAGLHIVSLVLVIFILAQ